MISASAGMKGSDNRQFQLVIGIRHNTAIYRPISRTNCPNWPGTITWAVLTVVSTVVFLAIAVALGAVEVALGAAEGLLTFQLSNRRH